VPLQSGGFEGVICLHQLGLSNLKYRVKAYDVCMTSSDGMRQFS
jgi:hypothetical protein